MPPIAVRFRRFTSLNTTIRLREGQIFVSLSDLLEGAPESVVCAIAHILLAKLYKKPIDASTELRYKRFASSAAVTRQTELIRHARGSKRYFGPEGPLLQSRRSLRLAQPALLWRPAGPSPAHLERAHAKRSLGHYDAAHNTIVVSRVFDRPSSPATPSNTCSTTRCCTSSTRCACAVCAAASTPRIQGRRIPLPATDGAALAFIKRHDLARHKRDF
jgi:hypothetical protein